MKHPLLPERPLSISPTLAATIGLEEAVLLTALGDLMLFLTAEDSDQGHWYTAEAAQLQQLLPFWRAVDIQRVATSLRNQGTILLGAAPYSSSAQLKFAFPSRLAASVQQPSQNQPQQVANPSANLIGPNWVPDTETMARITQLGVPEHFVREQLPEFVTYWRDRGEPRHSFAALFLKQVKSKWEAYRATAQRKQPLPENWRAGTETLRKLADEGVSSTFVSRCQQRFVDYHHKSGKLSVSWDLVFNDWVMEDWEKQERPFIEKHKPEPMTREWQPSDNTWEQIERFHISREFAARLIPDFIYQWIERGAISAKWGEEFIKYARTEWSYFCENIEKEPIAKPIARNWKPSTDCLEHIVNMCKIDNNFAQRQIEEFRLYWQEVGKPQKSWDMKFLANVRYKWAQRHKIQPQIKSNEKDTRSRTLYEDLTDTSWI
ncbi:MAG: hypothetical protein K0U59_11160 [Gammaproteobacteria bacterium]|nr:hypothetical protein [Gammaproteobacteria bacterium]